MAHTFPVLAFPPPTQAGLQSAHQGERVRISKFNKIYVNGPDLAGTIHLTVQAKGITEKCKSSTGFASVEEKAGGAVGEGGSVGVHSVSCKGDEILVGTRGAHLLVLDMSTVWPELPPTLK